jgi:lysozyme
LNAHHKLNKHGLYCLTLFEKGPDTVRLSTNGAALETYICPGGKLTIGYGCTRWFGGAELLPGYTLRDEAHALELLADQVIEYEIAVRELVTVPITSNQFSALVCFSFNVGIKALSGSTLLRHVNASRFDDAADAFGMWLYSTTGQHKQAMRGLLRRRYFEACQWMNYDGTVACSDEAVALVRERPPNNIGTDKVLFKTPFKDVLTVAQRYPLPPLDEPELVLSTPIKAEPVTSDAEARGKAGQPVPLPGPAPAGPAIEKPASNGPASVAAGEGVKSLPPTTPAAPVPAPVKPPPLPKDAAPTSNDPKDMLLSRRAWGLAVTAVGTTQFVPRGASEWLNNEGNRELLSWLIVVIVGVLLYQYGKYKAKRPLK